MSFKVGIDVGGTFTDLFLWSGDGSVDSFKVPSTPQDPSIGVLHGLGAMAESRQLDPAEFARQIELIVHGTTVTTNAVLTRGGASTGLITTDGVRDALEMRRGIREQQYDNRYRNVVPLVPRSLRRTVQGRLDFRGEEIHALSAEDVREAVRLLADEGVSSVAICFMHAYSNPEHERAAAEIVREMLPEAYLSVSSQVLPTIRFYDRVSTTVLDAYVGPVLGKYLQSLTAKLTETDFGGVLLIMQSNGGVALPQVTSERPATTLLSGPAAGPRAAAACTEVHGSRDCILVDMGGTSFDASLVRDGSPAMNTEGEIDRLRITLPMLDIATIGAGGGSIGWIDQGGLLRMGPASAGAVPGPACYSRGGERPTCTDADLLLGYLDPGFFAGGTMRLDRSRAERAVREQIADPLGIDLQLAAAGMYGVINANMAHGVREITIKRGLDPREFPMVVAGGAGGIHACMIARELEIPTLLVPSTASTLCATGMLLCDLQHDFVRSCVGPLDGIAPDQLAALVTEMSGEGERQLQTEGASQTVHEIALDLRYLKQYHEVTLPVERSAIETGDYATIADAFHALHDRLYGYDLTEEGTGLELINVRVRSIGRTPRPTPARLKQGGPDPSAARKGERRVFVPERESFADVDVYDGHRLLHGNAVSGPALIEKTDTTIFVSADYAATVDEYGSVLLRQQEIGKPA
ncbi:MAG: hydantoinase/oxoprolinase family protein [bacterium]|nr:hydantoinase/oxoprolinase family protein [bacterium]